jgi:uncharacterized protein YecE (DUF72 family)
MGSMAPLIHVGTSGYSYDDWVGPYYPPGTRKPAFLDFYARDFDCCEVNYTYYTMPAARTLAAMLAKTPKGFLFAIKAHSSMTHEREQGTPATFAAYRTALQPLIEAGRLACILGQFPPSFKPTPDAFDYLRHLREQLADLPLVIEFRHVTWATDEVFAFLREHQMGYCCVDEPRLQSLMPPVAVATSDIGYVRFHGRNYEKWWHHDEAWERHNYLYTETELAEWLPRVRGLADEGARVTYVFFNNHYQAQAAINAQQFRRMLQEKIG